MDLKKHNILFIGRAMQQAGAENVILQLCEIFKPQVNNIIVCAGRGFNKKALNDMGIKFVELPDVEKKDPFTIIKIILILKKIIAKENISIIHTHHRMASFYVAFLKLYKNRIFISTAHNTFYDKKKLTRFTYKHCNVIACGEMVKKNLVDYYKINEKKLYVAHNSVKSFSEKIVDDKLINDYHKKGYFLIGNIGRLSKQKGMEYYIKSIPMVIKKHPNTKFLIVGDGEEKTKLLSLSKDLKIEKNLIFMGFRKDIRNIMSQLDLIVLSSLWEGLPLTPIEAFSVGKTVIGTSVDGTPEIIRNNKDGFLIEPRNPEMIAEKINYLIENPKIKQQFEDEAKKRFIMKFSFEKMKKKYTEIYLDLIKNNK